MVSYRAKDFIDAIPGSGGIITTIANRVGCSWNTAKKYITEYATVKQAYDDECARVTDAAEKVVIGSFIRNDDPDIATAKWYLTMKGRERGYAKTERLEADVQVGPRVIGVKDFDPDSL